MPMLVKLLESPRTFLNSILATTPQKTITRGIKMSFNSFDKEMSADRLFLLRNILEESVSHENQCFNVRQESSGL